MQSRTLPAANSFQSKRKIPGFRELCRRRGIIIIRARVDVRGNNVFQTQQDCYTYELAEIVKQAEDLHRLKSLGALALRGGVYTGSYL